MGYRAKISEMRAELRVMNKLIPQTMAALPTCRRPQRTAPQSA